MRGMKVLLVAWLNIGLVEQCTFEKFENFEKLAKCLFLRVFEVFENFRKLFLKIALAAARIVLREISKSSLIILENLGFILPNFCL